MLALTERLPVRLEATVRSCPRGRRPAAYPTGGDRRASAWMDQMPVHVDTSGWRCRDWRGGFCPAALPQRRWLEHHAAAFA